MSEGISMRLVVRVLAVIWIAAVGSSCAHERGLATTPDKRSAVTHPQIAPYGSWKSPITSDLIVQKSLRLGQIVLDGDDIYWTELRPDEGGRTVIVRDNGLAPPTDVTPAPFNVRTTVHEYGGRSFTVDQGLVTFSNYADQQLYRHRVGEEPMPLTAEPDLRTADCIHSPAGLVCVVEDHSGNRSEPENRLGLVRNDGSFTTLAHGADFYAAPALSPDGSRLAWVSWNHPNMPWDGTELWVASLDREGNLGEPQKVAGGERESVFQPQWSPNGDLFFVSDPTGWWNLYRWRGGEAEALWETDAEFGLPLWVFGMSTFAIDADGQVVCSSSRDGVWQLATLNPDTGQHRLIDTLYTTIHQVRASNGTVVFIGGSPSVPSSVVKMDLSSGAMKVLRRSSSATVDPDTLSIPESIRFPSAGGRTAHAYFYGPKNREFAGPDTERPPLVVISHGGPTGATSNVLNLAIQFWTSRGIAVVDVNYGGSTGYGREYRERLRGQWGIVDVEDCVHAAQYLAQQGRADTKRLAIRGGSAGGYTTLAALAFTDVFSAGASYYGVSDLEALAKDTHKFESRYLDGIVGPYPEQRELYLERSPIHHAETLACPVIFFQGLEDKVVPADQAERMVDALKQRGIPVAYVPFEGEQHGFRRSENQKRALDCELTFYSRVFGFALAEPGAQLDIENLD